jgi:hypothetical protein
MTKQDLEKLSRSALALAYNVTEKEGVAVPTIIGSLAGKYVEIAIGDGSGNKKVRKILLEEEEI